ncbi:hypothetical protein DDW44_15545 [Streptomyces tirandamycinicus]|uniref:Redoxin domain-containing protein n=1 Tax=Streptomyces tirandamycinicus TaxID=2174846 RepID=A0A2S1SUF8_9ACTN|nr:hypothetical protein DDW44_15545 [Streptomyces tirandamycinicus]
MPDRPRSPRSASGTLDRMNAAASPAPRRRARVRAPELIGKGGWLNTGGKSLTLADLRGKCVVVDFWIS